MSSVDELSSLLAALSPEEQAIIRPVLERDLEFQRREKERILSIKAEVGVERKGSEWKEPQYLGLTVPTHRGSASSGISSGESFGSQASLGSSAVSPISPLGVKSCTDCGTRLGVLFNSGVRCIRCDNLLCELCRVFPHNDRNGSAPHCKKCHRHREVLAASGEWMGIEENQSISATILTKMRRESEHRARSPEQFRTRNMSLPPISGSHLLGLPTEQRPQSEVGDKFWKGSPSPRSPFSPYQLGLPHMKEAINSPSPRPLTPNSHIHNFIPQDTEEEMGEDEMGAFPSLDHTRDRRLSWTTHTKKNRQIGPSSQSSSEQYGKNTDRSEAEEEVRMRGSLVRGGPSASVTSSISSYSRSQYDSISIGSMNSMDGGMSMRSLSSLSSPSTTSPHGDISLRLQYLVHSASLSISIIGCTRLPNCSEGGLRPNPYVKIVLVKKGTNEVRLKHKTRSRRGTNDPHFNYEIQLPNVTKSELEQHVLRLSVCHRDLLQNSNVIGEVHLPLNNYPWHMDKCSFPLEGKSETPPDPAPSSLRKVRITITFQIVDRERKIGTLRVRLQSITFHSSDLRLGPVIVCGKLFMGGRRMAREQSGRMRIPNPNPGKETSADHCLIFQNINLNDLHLQMFVFTMWEQNGLMSSRSMGQAIINHTEHRRNVPYPSHCPCPQCSPWHRLIDNPSLALSFPLPLSTTTLDDPSLSLL